MAWQKGRHWRSGVTREGVILHASVLVFSVERNDIELQVVLACFATFVVDLALAIFVAMFV